MLLSLKQLLEPEFEVVSMADNVLSLLDALKVHRVRLVVLGVSLAEGETASFPQHLVARHPELRVVVVGLEADPVVARAILDGGAAAYVVAATAADELLPAVREAMRGRTFVSDSISGAESTCNNS